MSGIEKLNELMNAVRGVTGNTAKMTLSEATTSLLNVATGGLMYYTTIDLSSSDYDQDLWYPVRSTLFSKQTMDRVSAIIPEGNPAVMKWGNWKNNSAIDTDTSANAMATVDMLTNHQGYGYNSYALAYVLINQFNSVKDGKNPICYDQNPNNGGYVFWLRGGSTYQLGITQPNSKWIVINKDTNINGFDVKPQPYPGNWKLAGSAVKAFSLEDVFSKLGGVINPVLSAFRRIVTPLMGGVAYVA